MSSVSKVLNLVRLYPSPFVKGSSILFMLAGFTGTVLKAFMPIPAFVLVLGIGLWSFQGEISEKIRSPQGEMMQQMQSMMQDSSEVEK